QDQWNAERFDSFDGCALPGASDETRQDDVFAERISALGQEVDAGRLWQRKDKVFRPGVLLNVVEGGGKRLADVWSGQQAAARCVDEKGMLLAKVIYRATTKPERRQAYQRCRHQSEVGALRLVKSKNQWRAA